jgi:hypothetical protein
MTTVRLKHNEYWGKRSGTVHPQLGNIFPGKRKSSSKREGGQKEKSLYYHLVQNAIALGWLNGRRIRKPNGQQATPVK